MTGTKDHRARNGVLLFYAQVIVVEATRPFQCIVCRKLKPAREFVGLRGGKHVSWCLDCRMK